VIRSISHIFSCVLFIVFAFTFLKSQASTLCFRFFSVMLQIFSYLSKTSSKFLSILLDAIPLCVILNISRLFSLKQQGFILIQIGFPYMYATFFILCLVHPQEWQFRNQTNEDTVRI